MTGVIAALVSRGGVQVVVTPPSASGTGLAIVQTNSVTASVIGGGFTFEWSFESGDDLINPDFSTASATQRWTAINMAPGETRSAVWRVTALSAGIPLGFETVNVFVQRP